MSKIINILYGLIGMTLISSLLSFSCGVREERESIPLEDALIGSWQHVYDTTGISTCDPNLDCRCSDYFNFYSNRSFDRNMQCSYKKGSYEIANKKLRLIYVGEYPQVYDYFISEQQIILIKENTEHSYVRKPFRVRLETGAK